MNSTDYQTTAQNFLEKTGITFSQVLIGSDCPMFCEDKEKGKDMDKVNTFPRRSHIHGKHYRCTFSRKNYSLIIDFWNSYADEEFNAAKTIRFSDPGYWRLKDKYKGTPLIVGRNKVPTSYDVLACLEKNDPGTFEDFCSDLGYDSDSIKAHRIYLAVQQEWAKVRSFFSPEEIEELQEIS